MSEFDIEELVKRLRWMPNSMESKAADIIDMLRQKLEAAESRADKVESAFREARDQEAHWYKEKGTLEIITATEYRELLSIGSIMQEEFDPVFSAPVPAMPVQNDKPSLAQQLEFVTAERDGIRKHRDQLLEKLGNAPHWVAINDPADMPDDTEHVLWDGCDLHIDFTDTEVEYGTTFFSNGTEATHYLANLTPPLQSEVKPSC